MDETNVNVQQDLLRLRQRMNDLQRLGYMTPESFGTYQQTVLQIWQEAERSRQTCLHQAEVRRQQAAAAAAEAGAYSTIASIMFRVVNGFAEAGEKRAAEEAERAAEKRVQEEEEAAAAARIAQEAADRDHAISTTAAKAKVAQEVLDEPAKPKRRGRKT